MRLYALLALVGAFLAAIQPMLQAQDGKAKQERAIAEIKKLGGKVEVDAKRPDRAVIAVDLKHTKVVDASLEHLKGLTKLEKLYLKGTPVTDDGMIYIKGLTNIEVLELGRTKVTDKALEHLKGFTRLQTLDLAGTEVTNKGLEHLKGLSRLQTLDLSGTKVTNEGIDDLQKALPKVKIVR
jgi:Leucine-rich repeat (LRR) protein